MYLALRWIYIVSIDSEGIIELFMPTIYYLTPILIAPRVIMSGVKLR